MKVIGGLILITLWYGPSVLNKIPLFLILLIISVANFAFGRLFSLLIKSIPKKRPLPLTSEISFENFDFILLRDFKK